MAHVRMVMCTDGMGIPVVYYICRIPRLHRHVNFVHNDPALGEAVPTHVGPARHLQRRFRPLTSEHVLNDVFGPHTGEQFSHGIEITSILHAAFPLWSSDANTMRVDFASSESDERRCHKVKIVQRRQDTKDTW